MGLNLQMGKINPNLIIGGVVVAFVLYKVYQYLKPSDETIDTLGEGLSHPLTALGALVTNAVGGEVTVNGGTKLTDNYKYYIELNGGIDKYIKDQQNGAFKGAPYNASTDYKALYAKSNKWLSVFSNL